MLPRQHLKAGFFQEACQPLDDKQEVPLHQPYRDCRANRSQNSKPRDVGDGFLSAPLFLLGLESGVACASSGLLLRMVDGAGGIGADFVDRAHIGAFRDDGLRRKLARLELRTFGVVFRLRLVISDRGVLVARQNRTAFLLPTVGGADLYDLGLGGNGLGNVGGEFRLVALWIGAAVGLLSEAVPEQEFVVARPLGAVGATARRGEKIGIALFKGSGFQ